MGVGVSERYPQALQFATFQTARKSEQLQALQSLRCGYFWRKEHAMKTNLSDHDEECRFCNWLKLVLSPQSSDFGWEEPSIRVHSKARYFNKKETVFPHIQDHDTSCPSQATYSPSPCRVFPEKEQRKRTSAVHMFFVGLSKGSNYQNWVANEVSNDNMVNPLLVGMGVIYGFYFRLHPWSLA